MKVRSLLPRRWLQAPRPAALTSRPSKPRAWALEALEPRMLLSADPVLGAVHLALAPDDHALNLADDAYHADAHLLTVDASPTMHALAAPGSPQVAADVLTGAVGPNSGNNYSNGNSVHISGAATITVPGTISLGSNNTNVLAGNSSATTDLLTLNAGGNIAIHGFVNDDSSGGGDALSGLTITAAQNVTFDQDVTINGNLSITATGIVTFTHGITLGTGGSLTINGATQLVLRGPVTLGSGNISFSADEIDFLGIASEQISGTGSVTLRPANLATPMALFSPAGAATTGVLNLENSEMAAFKDGFSSFTFGYQVSGHAVNGAGAVQVGASSAVDSLAMRDAVSIFGGSISVTDFSDRNAILRLNTGDRLTLDAYGDISFTNAVEADHLTLTSATGKIVQSDSNVDGVANEPLRALDLTASAVTGITLGSLEVNQLDVVNSGQGGITLNENAARSTSRFADTDIPGTVTVLHLAQTGVTGSNGISLTSHAGTSLTDGSARPGDITLAAGSGITLATDGALSITALGTGSDINLLAPVSVHGGAVTLSAADVFNATAAAPISSTGASAVSISSGTGNLTLAAAVTTVGGTLTLNSGAGLDLSGITLDAGPGGGIALTSVGDLRVGIINASSTITLTSTGGAILDALAGDAANLRGEAALATLSAANGIGTGAAPLHTAIASLTASASGTGGGIFIAEDTALSIAAGGLTTAGSGAIVVRNTAGDLTVLGPVHANGTGHILLESIAGNLALQSDVLAQAGSISLLAALALTDTGTEVRSRGTNQTLDLRAGGALTLASTTLLATANAGQRLQAGGALVIGSVDAGTGTVSATSPGAITAAAQTNSIAAGSLRLQAGTSIGTGAEPLQLRVGRLAAAAPGLLAFNELDDISIGSVADPAISRVGALGTVSALSPGSALAGLAGTTLVLNAGGAITLDSAAQAGANLRLSAGTGLTVNAGVSSTGGQLTLLAGGAISHTASGSLTTSGGAIDEQAGGALTFAATTTVNTAGGRLRLQSGGVLTLGQLNAGSGEAWLQGTRLVAAANSSAVDLTAGAVRLIATGTGANDGIGVGSDALSLQVQRLAVQSAGLGGVYLSEADAVTVDSIAASTGNRVQADGSVAAMATDASLGGLNSATSLVLTAGTDLTTLLGVYATRARLAAGNDLSLNAELVIGGVLSLAATRDLIAGPIAITAAGSLDWIAGRDLSMQAGTTATAQGASQLQSGRNLLVGQIDVGSTRALTLNAGGSLRDADVAGDTNVNLKAGKLVLIATAGIGQAGNALETTATYLGASAGTGGLFIDETDGLGIAGALGTSFGTVQRVAADGTLSTLTTLDQQGLVTSNAPLVLRLLGGPLSVDAAVNSQGGAIRLDASGAVTLNAAVTSAGGALSLIAGGAVQQAAAGSITSVGGSLDLQVTGAWTMAQGSRVASSGGALRLAATGALALAQLDAGTGAMSVTASQVKDLANDPPTDPDLIAASIVLRTTGTTSADGVGAATDAIETAVQRLAVDTAGGGIFLSQTGDLVVDSIASFTNARVQVDGTVNTAASTDAALAGLRSSASLVVRSSGALTLNAAASASSTVLLTSVTDLTVGAALSSTTGSLSLSAGRDLLLNANVSSAGSTRSLDLVAVRDIVQAQNISAQTANGVIALQAGRDITIETLNAGTAGVALIAAGSVLDGDAAGDTEIDITAASLRVTAGGSVGTSANALETAVTTLNASAASLSVVQATALTVDRTATTLQRVAADGSAAALDLGAQEDLTTTGALLLTVNAGDLTLNGGTASTDAVVNAGGPLLLRAVTGSVSVKAGITAGAATSLRAGADLSFTATGDVTLAGAAALDVDAGGSINMVDGTVFASGSGAIRLSAVLNLAIGAVQTGGDVSLLARTITDAGAAETDVTARGLRIVTTGTGTTQGFGTGAAPLQLQVGTLAASIAGTGAGGFFAREADALRVDAVAVSVSRVGADGTTTTVADAALSDLVSAGNLVLVTGGTLTLADGGNADGVAVQSGGNVLLDVTGDLAVGAAVRSSSGAISLLATGGMALNADVAITRTGRTLELQAGGAITMAATANLATVDSALRVQAGGDLTVATVAAGLGSVSLISTGGSIVAASGHTGAEVTAAAVRLSAGVGVGTSSDRLDTNVQRISARAAGGGIWLQEVDAITITDVAVSVRRVSTLATTTQSIDDATQSDLITTAGNGSILLATTNGNISFADGTAPADGRSISADGSGSVVLTAGGPGAFVNLPAGAITQQGPVQINSGVKFDGAIAITAGQGGGRGDGPVTVTGAVDGTAGGAADTLTVTSDGADVTFNGAIGGTQRLDGLTIVDAGNVRFDQDVKLAGPLGVQAAGSVVFNGALDLSGGPSHTVTTGGAVTLANTLRFDGALALTAGQGGARGEGTITLAGAVDGVAGGTADTLVLTSDGADVVVNGAIGATQRLDGLTLTDARNVRFDQGVKLAGPLTVQASGNVAFNGALDLSGGTSHAVTTGGVIALGNTLRFDGAFAITAGQGGARGEGAITVAGAVDGAAGGAADTLVITSDGADVIFNGAIGATQRLDGLTVTDAHNVRFDQDVKIAGAVTLQASGRVEFKGVLDLSAGSLTITGATELVVGNVVLASGDAVIHVDALTLASLVAGNTAAKLELAAATATSGVTVGTVTGTGLALSAAQLTATHGFAQVQIGRTDQGATAVEAAALGGLATGHLTLAGSAVSVQGAAGASLNAAVQLLDLTTPGNLTLAGSMGLAGSGAAVHGVAGGSLRMAADGAINTLAGGVQLQSVGDLQVGRVDTRGAGGATGAVVLASTSGLITEANADSVADVYADLFTMRGRGPLLAAGASEVASALDVQANKLDVDASSGLILRDTGANGRTMFNLLDAGVLRQEVVALGSPARQASTAAAPSAAAAAAADAWAWLAAVRPLQELRDTTLTASAAPSLVHALAVPQPASTVFTADPAPLLPGSLAWLSLSTAPAALPQEPAVDAARFRVWSEELSL